MKAKTKFLKMYYKLPIKATEELVVIDRYSMRSLRICKTEIAHDTDLGKKILKTLGFEND